MFHGAVQVCDDGGHVVALGASDQLHGWLDKAAGSRDQTGEQGGSDVEQVDDALMLGAVLVGEAGQRCARPPAGICGY